MLTSRDLFPHEAKHPARLSLQDRILLRVSPGYLSEDDLRQMRAGAIERDCPDAAHAVAVHGW